MLAVILATTAVFSTLVYGQNMEAAKPQFTTPIEAVVLNDGVTSTTTMSALFEFIPTSLAASTVPEPQAAMTMYDEDNGTQALASTESSEFEKDVVERDNNRARLLISSNPDITNKKHETMISHSLQIAAQKPMVVSNQFAPCTSMSFPPAQAVRRQESSLELRDSQAVVTFHSSESDIGENKGEAKAKAKNGGLVTSVPQMQSTMAPVEAEQKFRSYTAARSSASLMSKSAASMSSAAAKQSQELNKEHSKIDKNLQKSCNGNKECEARYKDGMNKADKGKGKHQNAGTHLQLRVSNLMAALGSVAFAALSM